MMTSQTMKTFMLRAAFTLALTSVVARPASAQYQAAAGIQQQRHALESADAPRRSAARTAAPINGTGMAHGVLIGAGVGAVAGLVVAAATPHSDHSEDALGFIAFAAIGAFAGMVVGAAIGATR